MILVKQTPQKSINTNIRRTSWGVGLVAEKMCHNCVMLYSN